MLLVAPKGSASTPVPVTSEEDSILRAAFGRYGGRLADREAAAPIVRRYQQLGIGSWFLCDCRLGVERPPALVPVSQTHIRRHQDDRWPVHCDGCDFQRDPVDQRAWSSATPHRQRSGRCDWCEQSARARPPCDQARLRIRITRTDPGSLGFWCGW